MWVLTLVPVDGSLTTNVISLPDSWRRDPLTSLIASAATPSIVMQYMVALSKRGFPLSITSKYSWMICLAGIREHREVSFGPAGSIDAYGESSIVKGLSATNT